MEVGSWNNDQVTKKYGEVHLLLYDLCMLKYVVTGELLEDKQGFNFKVVMTVRYCIKLGKELVKNKRKVSQKEEEILKNE